MAEVRKFRMTINGKTFEVEAQELDTTSPTPSASVPSAPVPPTPAKVPSVPPRAQSGATRVAAPLPGLILDVKVSVGSQVAVGDVVAILEAMKMENEITASSAGVVNEVLVSKGDSVNVGDALMVIG